MSEATRMYADAPEVGASASRGGSFEIVAARPTVLVVDDVPYMLELASLFLGRTSSVITAQSGEEALAIAREQRPSVIVSDRRMPGMDGVAFCRAVARDPALASVPFVMLVSDDTGVERGLAVRAGAADVLAKPLSRIALVDSVSRLCRKEHESSMPRIELDVPISVITAHAEEGDRQAPRCTEKGIVRNLSRGGLFVETESELPTHGEVDLRFRLPDSADLLAPSAQVIWRRRPLPVSEQSCEDDALSGFGLRFLEVDGATLRRLDDFVYERVPVHGVKPK